MKRATRIYSRQQQIKLIDNILCNLCTVELNPDGRKYLVMLKARTVEEIERLMRPDGKAFGKDSPKSQQKSRHKPTHSERTP